MTSPSDGAGSVVDRRSPVTIVRRQRRPPRSTIIEGIVPVEHERPLPNAMVGHGMRDVGGAHDAKQHVAILNQDPVYPQFAHMARATGSARVATFASAL